MPSPAPATNNRLLKVLLVEDDTFVIAGLRAFLDAHGLAVREARDVASALHGVRTEPPDVAVIDISIPPSPESERWPNNHLGIELVRQFKTLHPAMGVVLLSAYDTYLVHVQDLLHEGLRGLAYQLKGRRSRSLLDAVYQVMDGHVVIDPEAQAYQPRLFQAIWDKLSPDEQPWVKLALDRFDDLTPAERRAAHLLAASHNTQGIAERLHLRRADTLVGRVYSKLSLDELPVTAPHLRQIAILVKACLLRDLQSE